MSCCRFSFGIFSKIFIEVQKNVHIACYNKYNKSRETQQRQTTYKRSGTYYEQKF